MKYIQRRSAIVLGLVIGSSLLLSACSQEGMFRNRNFDYLRTDVQQLPPLKMPPDVTGPQANSYLTIPAGQDNYAPTTQASVNLTPPNMNIAAPMPVTVPKSGQPGVAQPAAKATPAMSPAAISVNAPKPATNAAAATAGVSATVMPNSTVTGNSTTEVNPVAIAPANVVTPAATMSAKPPATSRHWFTPRPVPAAELNPVVPVTKAKSHEADVTNTAKTAVVTPKTNLSFNSNNQGMITVNEPYTTTWQKVGEALVNSNFMITDQDAQKGFYFVAAKNLPSADHTYMVSIMQTGAMSQIQIYDMTAQLATSFEASDLLKAINAGLSQ